MTILRRKDLARSLGVSVRTTYRWQALALLPPPVRLGPRVTGWIEDDIRDFLQSLPRVERAAR